MRDSELNAGMVSDLTKLHPLLCIIIHLLCFNVDVWTGQTPARAD